MMHSIFGIHCDITGDLPELLVSRYFNSGGAYWQMRYFLVSTDACEEASRANFDNLEANDAEE
jgi:hypothetical protein